MDFAKILDFAKFKDFAIIQDFEKIQGFPQKVEDLAKFEDFAETKKDPNKDNGPGATRLWLRPITIAKKLRGWCLYLVM